MLAKNLKSCFWPQEMQQWERMHRAVKEAMYGSVWNTLTGKQSQYYLSKDLLLSEQERLERNLLLIGPKTQRCFISWFLLSIAFLLVAYYLPTQCTLLFNISMWAATIAFIFGSIFLVFYALHLELLNFKKRAIT